MKDLLSVAATIAFGMALFLLYIFGMYKIVVDDHRYTTKDVALGLIVFPYPWWVGGKEVYRIATTSSENRALEEKCLDATEAAGLQQKSRLRFCECLVETRNEGQCRQKIFSK